MKTHGEDPESHIGGTPTFMVLDIDGSEHVYTREINVVSRVMDHYRKVVGDLVKQYGGLVIEELCLSGRHFSAYSRPTQAILAAFDLNRAIETDPLFKSVPIHIRISICTAEHQPGVAWSKSPGLLRADAIERKIHGEQIVVTLATQDLARDLLPSDFGLKDLGTVQVASGLRGERVFQLTHPDLREEFPPIDEAEESGDPPPPRLTFFLGREHEIEDVEEALDSSRLVTLYGPGGVGKTSLACRVALGKVDEYERGVRYVDYTPAPRGSKAVQAIADSFRIRARSKATLESAVLEYFAPRQILLLLDNCDSVSEDLRDFAARFLKACPRIQLLVTCQNQIRAEGEFAYKVGPMGLPPESETSTDEIRQYDAVALFVDRARSQKQDFVLTKSNAQIVSQICHRLDGLPLAIELAAPLISIMTLGEILSGLDDRFNLLRKGRGRGLHGGADTLLEMIRITFERLEEPDRALLRRLAVFAGGWTLDSAIEVCTDENLSPSQIRSAMDTLFENSLIERTMLGGLEGTYRFLETIREFAMAQLTASGELDNVRSKQCQWCLDLVKQNAASLSNEHQVFSVQVLERNRDNLRLALEWAARPEQPSELGHQFIFYCYPLWLRKTWLAEGSAFVKQILAKSPEEDSPERARAHNTLGVLLTRLGDIDVARAHHFLAISMYDRMRSEIGLASAYLNLAINSSSGHQREAALLEFEESIARWRAIGHNSGLYAALGSYAEVLVFTNRLDEAEKALDEADRLSRDYRDTFAQAAIVFTRGELALARGNSDSAETHFRENVLRSRSIGNLVSVANSLRMLAYIALRRMAYARSAMLLGCEKKCRDDVAGALPPRDSDELESGIAELKQVMGFAKFEDQFDVGYTMRLSEMVDLALSDGTLSK